MVVHHCTKKGQLPTIVQAQCDEYQYLSHRQLTGLIWSHIMPEKIPIGLLWSMAVGLSDATTNAARLFLSLFTDWKMSCTTQYTENCTWYTGISHKLQSSANNNVPHTTTNIWNWLKQMFEFDYLLASQLSKLSETCKPRTSQSVFWKVYYLYILRVWHMMHFFIQFYSNISIKSHDVDI